MAVWAVNRSPASPFPARRGPVRSPSKASNQQPITTYQPKLVVAAASQDAKPLPLRTTTTGSSGPAARPRSPLITAPVTAQVNGSTMTIAWQTSASCQHGYQVLYRRVTHDNSWTVLDIASSQTSSHTVDSLDSGKYVVRVACIETERRGRKRGPSVGRAVAVVN